MNKKIVLNLTLFCFLFVLLSVQSAEASVNGWMAEAMKSLNANNLQTQIEASKPIIVKEIKEQSITQKIVNAITNAIKPSDQQDFVANEQFYINLSKETVARGYTINAFNKELKISLAPNVLKEASGVELTKLKEQVDSPWRLNMLGSVYQLEFKNKGAYNNTPFQIELAYSGDTDTHKEIFFYDKNKQAWRPLPSKDYLEEGFVRAEMHLPFARVAIFSYPEVLTKGKASWYAFRGGDFAASPDFEKGSIIKVTNTDNDKSINVTINDWGPERDLFPDRAIDLDKVAFGKISSIGAGIINVILEPIHVAQANGLKLGLTGEGATVSPNVQSRAAIVLNEENQEIIYEKNATTTLPIASLTKLISIKTFFDTRPSLNRIVEYKDQDELNNHRYVDEPWRIASLDLTEGDEVTLEDLLYASLVGSSNNTVETIVRASGLSRDDFVRLMNENAKNWGANSTHFIEPTGLSPENISTVLDYAIMTKELYKNPIIKKTSTINKYRMKVINSEKEYPVVNRNHLILKNTYRIVGSKTGYLDEAGYCLMTRIRKPDGEHLIIVVLGADNRQQTFSEVEELIQFGLLNDKVK